MSTFRTCTTPKDGWALVHHFLGNFLGLIPLKSADEKNEPDEEKKYKYTRAIDDIWAELLGKLYMIMRRMISNTHLEDAAKMQQIVDMIVEGNLADPEVCKAIHAKEDELNPLMAEFNTTLARLRAEHAK